MSIQELSVSPLPATLAELPSPAAAYAQVLPQLEGLPDEQLVAVNVDIPTVVGKLLARSERLQTLIPEATQRIRGFDPALFTQLETRAVAVLQAHTMHMTAVTPLADDLTELLETGMALRLRLFNDAHYLGQRGIVDGKRIESVKCLNGFRNVATDLMALVNLFRASWGDVAGKCAISEADLALATTLSQRIFKGVAVRERNQAISAQSAVLRQRAYSLLFNGYDEIRSIVSFLRWKQGDADDFAPSLFAGRRSGRRDGTPDEQDAPATPGGAVAPGGGSVAPVAGGTAQPASPFASEPAVPAGHQGGSPFLG